MFRSVIGIFFLFSLAFSVDFYHKEDIVPYNVFIKHSLTFYNNEETIIFYSKDMRYPNIDEGFSIYSGSIDDFSLLMLDIIKNVNKITKNNTLEIETKNSTIRISKSIFGFYDIFVYKYGRCEGLAQLTLDQLKRIDNKFVKWMHEHYKQKN